MKATGARTRCVCPVGEARFVRSASRLSGDAESRSSDRAPPGAVGAEPLEAQTQRHHLAPTAHCQATLRSVTMGAGTITGTRRGPHARPGSAQSQRGAIRICPASWVKTRSLPSSVELPAL